MTRKIHMTLINKQTNKQTNKCFIVNQDAHNEQYNQEKKITVYN
jgi:hypothetical protein